VVVESESTSSEDRNGCRLWASPAAVSQLETLVRWAIAIGENDGGVHIQHFTVPGSRGRGRAALQYPDAVLLADLRYCFMYRPPAHEPYRLHRWAAPEAVKKRLVIGARRMADPSCLRKVHANSFGLCLAAQRRPFTKYGLARPAINRARAITEPISPCAG